MKANKMITLDAELVAEGENRGISFSQVINDYLKIYFQVNIKDTDDLAVLQKELETARKEKLKSEVKVNMLYKKIEKQIKKRDEEINNPNIIVQDDD